MKKYTLISLLALVNMTPIVCGEKNTIELVPLYQTKSHFYSHNGQSQPHLSLTNTPWIQNQSSKIIEYASHIKNIDKLIELLHDLQYTEEFRLNEIGQYIYDKKKSWLAIDEQAPRDAIIILYCLKKYFITIKQKSKDISSTNSEDIPSIDNAVLCYSKLSTSLNLTNNTSDPYPAFFQLTKNISQISKQNICAQENLIDCLYDKNKNITPHYSRFSGKNEDLCNIFYEQSYDLISSEQSALYKNLIRFIYTFNDALFKCHNNTTTNFISRLFSFNPTKSILTKLQYLGSDQFFTASTKKRIIFLYSFLEKYNKACKNKPTPSSEQYDCYNLIKNLRLPLPNSHIKTLFNNKQYSFKEFKIFLKETNDLIASCDKTIEILFNKMYSS